MPGVRKERIMKPKDRQSAGKLSQRAGNNEAALTRPAAAQAARTEAEPGLNRVRRLVTQYPLNTSRKLIRPALS